MARWPIDNNFNGKRWTRSPNDDSVTVERCGVLAQVDSAAVNRGAGWYRFIAFEEERWRRWLKDNSFDLKRWGAGLVTAASM